MPLVNLKIMSYNVQGHADRFLSSYLDRIAEVITAERPDIVGLQEVHRSTSGPRLVDQAEELARRTGLDVRFGASYGRNGRELGNAVLCAGAVGETTVHPLPGGSEPRTLLQTRVAVRGVELDVYVTHFSAWGRLGRKARLLQATHLVGLLQHARPPFVLVGDLNASPETPELRHLLAATLFRSCGELVCTHRLMRSCLDYVFADPAWTVLATRVPRSGPSDHWPVVVELQREVPALSPASAPSSALSSAPASTPNGDPSGDPSADPVPDPVLAGETIPR
jgi:endonuclease/exonuclease/phosphatase family metal-dependent hydrolase